MKITRRPRTPSNAQLLGRCKHQAGDLTPSGQPVVLGIDPSLTKLGASVYAPEDGRHLTVMYTPRFSGARRLHDLYTFVFELASMAARSFELREITLEGYSFASQSQQHKIGEGGGVGKLALLHALGHGDRLAYPTLVAPNSLKKFVTGKGRAEKNQMLLATYKKWGVEFPNDDMSDAYGLARIGAALLCDSTDHRYEHEVVNSLERNTEWAPKP